MQVTVELHASFRIGRFKADLRQTVPDATIRQIVRDLGIAEREVGIILLNGRHAYLGDPLKDGDRLSLMPRIGGG